jgi:CheY-like chemotaxis protein
LITTRTGGRLAGLPSAWSTSGGTSTRAPLESPSNRAENALAIGSTLPSTFRCQPVNGGGMVASVPSVTDLRERVRGWLRREPKVVLPRSIMIIDNDADSRETTARVVESLGYEAVKTTSLAEAVRQLEEEHDPDFILLGFELDDADGLEALTKLREVDDELVVIMLARDLWDTRVSEALRRGAVAYLARPFGTSDLREVLGRG